MRRMRRARAVATLLTGSMSVACGALAAVTVEYPRGFGYVVGDEFEVHVRSDVRGGEIDPGSLPKPGRVAASIALRAVEPGRTLRGDPTVRLRYQVIGASDRVETLEVPRWELAIRTGKSEVRESVESLAFTVSPLTPVTPLARAGLEELRPPLAPPRIDERPFLMRLAVYGALGVLVGAYWAWRTWGRAWLQPRRAPFSRANLELARLDRDAPGADAEALRIAHRAFDRAAGSVVMGSDLAHFFARRPTLASLRADAEQLFALSASQFFGVRAAAPQEIVTLVADFCRRAARAERA